MRMRIPSNFMTSLSVLSSQSLAHPELSTVNLLQTSLVPELSCNCSMYTQSHIIFHSLRECRVRRCIRLWLTVSLLWRTSSPSSHPAACESDSVEPHCCLAPHSLPTSEYNNPVCMCVYLLHAAVELVH